MFRHVTCKKKMMKAVKIAWAWSYSGYFMQLYLLYNHKWKTHQKNCMLPRHVTRTTQQASTFLLHYFFTLKTTDGRYRRLYMGIFQCLELFTQFEILWVDKWEGEGQNKGYLNMSFLFCSKFLIKNVNCNHQFQPFLFSHKSLKNLFINKQLLINYTEKYDILCQFQFGFRKGCSTEQAV